MIWWVIKIILIIAVVVVVYLMATAMEDMAIEKSGERSRMRHLQRRRGE